MSVISLPSIQPASTEASRVTTNAAGASPTPVVAAARRRWSIGRFLVRAVVVLLAAAVGFVITVFIGVVTGLLPFGC